ncbi:Eco57I restriction-modification methylase domain-containing protein [Leptospira levettii]|uniref:site-specific DNA-methyltransferase (adenine-specific) n=1 Tax=Leptospira levettii TaxID=2023178 RepID=A0AAW5VFM7_9LEPT|nr:TaqI-like C-terminal specificity domain-containing protein [Leptospira levettii]MCW7467675.1 N-6 DNA methylase [Leptospira levettii]MCW7513355.1 N-6 DNA methylase [Leptospira levettii]MCW7517078.1 N-6 DNA methylase [Leptospira levettii]
MNKNEAFKKIESLINRFDDQINSYKRSDYNETQTRRDFIDPFFKALGWDIDNENGYAESYREVIHEDKVKIGSATKAPDYSFRLPGGKRLFFVEAKKPSVSIKDEILPAYQVRRYGWSAKLAISVITDFEEFAIYDCTKKPNIKDKPDNSRLRYLKYTEYLQEFDFLWDTFSKEKILQGGFDKFIAADTYKKGTTTVDSDFLASLENWRKLLATNISSKNRTLSEEEINYCVQQTIDRIIFLRIAEDRGIENYGLLKNCILNGDFYKNLVYSFIQADSKYNSGLFNLKQDLLTSKLEIDNKVIKAIINDLYYPLCPYEFSVISVEILGTAYEQFLGKQIKLDRSHRAKILPKPAVKKAGGVYYTPQYIVNKIVSSTLGPILDNKTPFDIQDITIADPACGSGSFLLGAYQYLIDWHTNYYTNNLKSLKKQRISPLTPNGNLSTTEKKRILLNNIYGVDIDINAVEVTKLSLLLKCLEGETEASIENQLKLINERVLPTLDENIKNGNSLVDTDFYDEELGNLKERIIKPFDWKAAFPKVFKKGGFDLIIGNPPWVSLNGKFGNQILEPEVKKYLISKYRGNTYRPNLYEYFVHRGLDLTKENGLFSFIVPDRLGFNEQFINLRNRLLKETQILHLIYKTPFPRIVTDTLIFNFKKSSAISKNYSFSVGEFGKKLQTKSIDDYMSDSEGKFSYEENKEIKNILDKIYKNPNVIPLGAIFESKTGVILDSKQITNKKIKTTQRKIARGRSIGRYQFLETFYSEFNKKTIKGGTNDESKLSKKEKILLRKTGYPLLCTFDKTGVYPEQSLYFLINNKTELSMEYFTGLLNSNIFQFVYYYKLITNKDSTPQLKKIDLDKFPILLCDLRNSDQKSLYNEIVKHVKVLLDLYQQLADIKIQSTIEQTKSKISYSENRINELFLKLYNLSEYSITIEESL